MKFYDTIEKYTDKNIDIYCDMDGVVAEYDIGNFDYSTIRPLLSTIKKLEELSKKENIKIYILSICKTDNIIDEKLIWFDKYMKFLNKENIILISKENKNYCDYSSKEIKSNYIKEKQNKDNITIVIDDDNDIIKFLRKNNDNIIIFQDSSLID